MKKIATVFASICLLCALAGTPAVAQTTQSVPQHTEVTAQAANQGASATTKGAPQTQAQPQNSDKRSHDRTWFILHLIRINILLLVLLLLIHNRRSYRRRF